MSFAKISIGDEEAVVTGKTTLESGVLMGVSALLYGLAYAFQAWLFHFSEHVSGIHWFYWPAGLRVLLVLVAGIHGAVGIFVASLWLTASYVQDLHGALLWMTAAASGFSAWVALRLLRMKGLISPSLSGLSSTALLQFALLYSGLNAVFHQFVWWIFDRPGVLFWVDLWPMFVGDLLGAVVFLYGLKWVLTLGKNKAMRCNQ